MEVKSWVLMAGGTEVSRMGESTEDGLSPAGEGEMWVHCSQDQSPIADGDGGYTLGPRIWPLEELRTAMLAEVKNLRDAAEAAGCTVPGIGRFDTDADSQRKINGSVVMAMLTTTAFSVEWRLADDNFATLDAAGMQAVGLMVGQHVAATQYRKNDLDAAIKAASDSATLAAIPITTGWPT